jgi:hypothetical protein
MKHAISLLDRSVTFGDDRRCLLRESEKTDLKTTPFQTPTDRTARRNAGRELFAPKKPITPEKSRARLMQNAKKPQNLRGKPEGKNHRHAKTAKKTGLFRACRMERKKVFREII